MLCFSARLLCSLTTHHIHCCSLSLVADIKCKQGNVLCSFCRDPEPVHHGVIPSLGNMSIRMRNMDIIAKNIKALYEVMSTVLSDYICAHT